MVRNKMHRSAIHFEWILFFLVFNLTLNSIILAVSASPTIRSSSQCSVPSCTQKFLINGVSNDAFCFNFQTNNDENFCAPGISCGSLVPCDSSGDCTSNTSVCIINSCCIQPVCLPLILVEVCSPHHNFTKKKTSQYTTTSTISATTEQTVTTTEEMKTVSTTNDVPTTERSFERVTSSNHSKNKPRTFQNYLPSSPIFHPVICPEATWTTTGTTAASFHSISPDDFFINLFDEIYVPDKKNKLIRKYDGYDLKWKKAFDYNITYEPTAIFIDLSDNLYILDSKNYRLYLLESGQQKMETLLSFDGCKKSIQSNSICFAKSLYVGVKEDKPILYISESSINSSHTNRIMRFEKKNTTGRVIAGSSTYGAGIKQLKLPETFFVDANENLYVADIGNARIQKFLPSDRNGQTIYSQNGLQDFIMDADGNFYVLIQSENILKKIGKKSMNIIQGLNQPTKVRFGYDGSIYILNQGNGTIQKFRINNNRC